MEDKKEVESMYTNPALPVTIPVGGGYGGYAGGFGGYGDGLSPAGANLIASGDNQIGQQVGFGNQFLAHSQVQQGISDIRRETECVGGLTQRLALESRAFTEHGFREMERVVAAHAQKSVEDIASMRAAVAAEGTATRDFLRDRELASKDQQIAAANTEATLRKLIAELTP